MIVQKDFLSKIKDFGLNSYEAKLWTALLSRGAATAGELSDIGNVPRSRSYDVLESLERKGFVVMKLGKPIKYIAIPPSEVVERVKKNIKEDADKQVILVDSLKKSDILEELSLLHKKGIQQVDPIELAGVVRGRDNLHSHFAALVKNAEKEISLITTEQGLSRKALELKSALSKAKENGVRIRILAPLNKENSSAANTLSKFAQVKHTNFNARFCVVDGKNISFMPLNDKDTHETYDFGIWVGAEPFTKSFQNLFDRLWDESK